jgi:1,2-phenylacetyl-CoA epoxidase PaaB subunit
MEFDVFDNNFKKVGNVFAENATAALQEAKDKFKFVAAPMVQETNEDERRIPRMLS